MHSIFTGLGLFLAGSLSAQNIGIGTSIPSEKLEVAGNIKADTAKTAASNTASLTLTTGAAAGAVLSGNASGKASWIAPKTIPGTVAASGTLNGQAPPNFPATASTWVFFGPTATVTLNGNQRVFINAAANLGKYNAGDETFKLDVGYQLQPATLPPKNAAAEYCIGYYPVFNNTIDVRPFSMAGTFKPAAGTYKIGYVAFCVIAGYLNFNDQVNGFYMIVNE